MNICLFSKDEITKPLPIKDERAQHIIKILHKKEGETFTAGVIDGKAGTATIQKISETQIEFNFIEETDGKLLRPLIMIIGFPRPIQLKRLLRDIAALGCAQVHLTGTELGEKSYLNSGLSNEDEVRKMLIDGSIQAGSTHLPEVFIHRNLIECLESVKTDANSLKLCLDNKKPAFSLSTALENNRKSENPAEIFVSAIGSERGWTDLERDLLEKSGFSLCSMGSRILRTETASTVAASLILDSIGVLN